VQGVVKVARPPGCNGAVCYCNHYDYCNDKWNLTINDYKCPEEIPEEYRCIDQVGCMKPINRFSVPEKDPFFSALLGTKWSILEECITCISMSLFHPNAPYWSKER
jgi:hypothetical protein